VIIPPAWWERAGVDRDVTDLPMPARFSAAMKVHHLGTYAALAVAWDYEEPADLVSDALALEGVEERPTRRAIAVWLHQSGVEGFERDVLAKLRRKRLVYDNYGHTAIVAKKLERMPLRPELQPTKTADIPLSTARLLQALEDGTVVHFRQSVLDGAAAIATRAKFGNFGSFRFGPPKTDPEADLTSLEAAALALHFLDDQPTRISPSDAVQF
jgi:hypothetical protein